MLFLLCEMLFSPGPLLSPLPSVVPTMISPLCKVLSKQNCLCLPYTSRYVAVNCLRVCLSLWAIIRLRVTTLLISCRMSLTSIFSPKYTTDFHNHVSSCFWTSPECPTISLKSLCPIPNTLILSQKCSFCFICFSYHHYLLSHFPGWEPKTQPSPLPSCHISH